MEHHSGSIISDSSLGYDILLENSILIFSNLSCYFPILQLIISQRLSLKRLHYFSTQNTFQYLPILQWGSVTHQMAVPVPSITCCVLNHHNLFYQIQNALAFNLDTCCHLALCLRLLPFHLLIILLQFFAKNMTDEEEWEDVSTFFSATDASQNSNSLLNQFLQD